MKAMEPGKIVAATKGLPCRELKVATGEEFCLQIKRAASPQKRKKKEKKKVPVLYRGHYFQ